jgi:hypothetical protein
MSLLLWAPLVGGLLLMLICLIPIISTKAISLWTGAVLVIGGLMFAAPTIDVVYKSQLGELALSNKALSNRAGQFAGQFAKLNKDIGDLANRVGSLEAKVGSPEAKEAASSSLPPVVIYYVSRQQKLAQDILKKLLSSGVAAAAFEDDFSQLSSRNRPTQDTVRIVYADATAQAAPELEKQLIKDFSQQIDPRKLQLYLNKDLTAGQLQIQIF